VPQEARSEARSVFNMNSVRLLKLIHEMNTTFFEESPFNVFCALNPNVANKEAELRRMLQKAETGPVTFITQPVFDNEGIDFIKEAKKRTHLKIFAGIIPVVSYKNAMFLNNEMPGINIPEKYITSFSPEMDRETAEQTGITIALSIARQVLKHCDGFYLTTPFNRVDMIGRIADGIKNMNMGVL
jgi:homocysteine S-methyltransferase